MRSRLVRIAALGLLVASLSGTAMGGGLLDAVVPVDCAGPVPDAQPGTMEWTLRDAGYMYCAEQRHLDQPLHPVAALPLPGVPYDAYREPSRNNGVRFRFQAMTIGGLAAEVYRPCATGTCTNMPSGLRTFDPPYPAVIILHGGLSHKELHWWSSQPLAEAGYLVVAFDAANTSPTAAEADTVLDWLLSGDDPFRGEVDAGHVGIAGHSAGGVVSSAFGQQDDRISSVVSWDRAQSGQMPADLVIRHPALFFFSDYNCQKVPVCQPEPYQTQPDPNGPGDKGEDFTRVAAAGVDSMQIALRAALHLDFVPSELAGNRYVESVVMYFTTAWFDRYLKGADDPGTAAEAYARLTAPVFDGSADLHNISQGIFDPVKLAASKDLYGGNVPYAIEGMPVADRVSFYYLSKCNLSVPGSGFRAISDDIRREGCPATSGS
jgi:dienelactone hydrolase